MVVDQDQLFVHYEIFKISKIQVKNTLAPAKSEYYYKKIKTCKLNQKSIFSVVNKVLHNTQPVLPNIINSDKYMPHCFNNFSVKRH